jgi:hypothetical protein
VETLPCTRDELEEARKEAPAGKGKKKARFVM